MAEFTQEHYELMGGVKEFMLETKGFKKTLFTVSIAIAIQVCTFLFLWGGLMTTVKSNTVSVSELKPMTFENTRNIDKILTRLEYIIRETK